MRPVAVLALVGVLAGCGGSLTSTAAADPVLSEPFPQQVNPVAAGDQGDADVGMAADGRFAVAYAETNAAVTHVYARFYGAGRVPAPAVVPINAATGEQSSPAIGMDADGDAVIVYVSELPASETQIRAQRVTASGALAGAEIPVSSQGQNRQSPSVAVAPDGRFAIAWDHNNSTVHAKLFAADGTEVTGELAVSQPPGLGPGSALPDIGMSASGAFAVVWQRGTLPGDVGQVPVRRYSALGVPEGDEFAGLTGGLNQNFSNPTVAVAGDGRFAVVAQATVAGGVLEGILGQRSDAAAAPVGSVFKVDSHASATVLSPDAAMDAAGNLLVVYEDLTGGPSRIRLRHFAPDGSPQGAEVEVGGGTRGRLALDATGGASVAFTSFDFGAPGPNGAFTRGLRYSAPTIPPVITGPIVPPAVESGTAPTPVGTASPLVVGAVASPPPARLPAFATLVSLPTTKRCVSRRSFRIRIRKQKGVTIVSAVVRVNGRKVKTVRGARITAPIDLRSLPRGRFTVELVATTSDGRTVRGKRRYRTCAPKRSGSNTSPL